MKAILKTENIYKTYHTTSGDVPVLKDVNIEIEEGKFYSIIGKSGSGKSTLLHILSGLDKGCFFSKRSRPSPKPTISRSAPAKEIEAGNKSKLGFFNVFIQLNISSSFNKTS